MAPSLQDYQYQFGELGFTLNGPSSSFPFFDITDVSGLDTAPIRTNTDDHQGEDGTYVDATYTSMRTVVISGNLYMNPSDMSTVPLLRGQFGPGAVQPFYFKEPGHSMQFLNAQGGGAAYDADNNRGMGLQPMQLTLLAGDPYIYDWPVNTDTAFYSTPASAGMHFNFGFNLGFGGAVLQPSATVTNLGTKTAWPIFALYGPLTNPVITDSQSDSTMPLNLTLSSNDVLIIDNRKKSVTLGGASRRSSMQGRQWFSVDPGDTDSFFLAADAGSGKMIVTMYSTYE